MLDWADRAACKTEDPDLFFPVGSFGANTRQVLRAKSVCRDCPVSTECLDWALTHDAIHGVWGGLTEDEREAMRRRRSAAFARKAG
jgi:WhiB family redox-sensing transcriptional regulator